ncbi:MAG TPA: hypothetical protein VGN00_25980 [Puia sp.]|jgi:hypothetical protein
MYQSPSLKKTEIIRVRITSLEKRWLSVRAKQVGLSTCDYIRKLAMAGKLDKDPALPPEVLAFRGQLHHLCGILHPFTQKRLDGDEFNSLERAEIKQIITTVGNILQQLKNHLL